MTSGSKLFRIFWYGELGVLILSLFLVFYVFNPDVPLHFGAALEGGEELSWIESFLAAPAAWILGAVGTLLAIAGARLARSVYLPGWQEASRLARRMKGPGDSSAGNPALIVFVMGLALIECTVIISLLLYVFGGFFNAYIILSGIALVGWVVARPESTAISGVSNEASEVEKEG